ncbi:short-chain dehydrogenase [Mycena vulgaris]|nr:short-chain dehydrogenase [Mycena vulgaris]
MNTRVQIFANIVSWRWVSEQRKPLELEVADLTGQTVIVTGGNRGIGLEAVKHFASMGVGHLIMACRDIAAGEVAIREILEAPGCNCESISCWPLDLASFASVKAFVTRFREENHSLNILVNNAGLMSFQYSQTSDDWETMLQVNYLSPVLLVMLLLPHFAEPPANSRILMLTSDTHYCIRHVEEAKGTNILATLNDPQHCAKTIGTRYFLSKLFSLFFARELARRRQSKSSPTIVAVNPGYCATNLDSEFKAYTIQRYLARAGDYFIGRTPEMGSRTIIHAAVNSEGKNQDGRYLANSRVERESDFALSEAGLTVQKRLWDETMILLTEIDPRVRDSIQEL